MRYEVLAGFSNGLLLIFIAFSIATEAIVRVAEPEPVDRIDEVIMVSAIGLVVNIVGVGCFHEYHVAHIDESGDDCECCVTDGTQDNMKGVFLHILADTLSSVGVVVSSFLIKYKGWLIADPLCSIFISFLIIMSVRPLMEKTTRTLVQQAPADDMGLLLKEILALPSVQGVRDPHFWTVAGGSSVCSLRMLVELEASEQQVLACATKLCRKRGYRDIAIQVEKPLFSSSHKPHFYELGKFEASLEDAALSNGLMSVKVKPPRGRRAGRRAVLDHAVIGGSPQSARSRKEGGSATSQTDSDENTDTVLGHFLTSPDNIV